LSPAPRYCFEDLTPGLRIGVGSKLVDRDEMLRFSRQFDPQGFHLDDAEAAKTPYGRIIASGWHTCSMVMRLMADNLMLLSSGMGSPGIDQVRWLKPVYAGDLLTVSVTVLDATPSTSKPDRGTCTLETIATGADGEVKMTMKSRVMFGRRQPA
jgi:acyl dehydratase